MRREVKMRRIDRRTVELTEAEVKAADHFNSLLDEGLPIVEAAYLTEVQYPGLDDKFYRYLRS